MTRIRFMRAISIAVLCVAASACHRASQAPTTAAPARGASNPSTSATASPANASAAKGAKATLPANVTSAVIAVGDSIYNNGSCYRCHGKAGIGSVNGPKLVQRVWRHGSGSFADIVATISRGVPIAEIKDPSHKLAMRARGGMQPLLTDDQVNAVAAYVYTISRK